MLLISWKEQWNKEKSIICTVFGSLRLPISSQTSTNSFTRLNVFFCHLQAWISYRFGDVLEYIFKNKYRKVTYFAIWFYFFIFKIYLTLYCKIVLLLRENKFGSGINVKPFFLPFTKHIAKPKKKQLGTKGLNIISQK